MTKPIKKTTEGEVIGICSVMTEKGENPFLAWVIYPDTNDYCLLVHAQSRNAARMIAETEFQIPYIYTRAKRLPGMDNKPFNHKDVKDAGFEFTEDDGVTPAPEDEFFNSCECEICRKVKYAYLRS